MKHCMPLALVGCVVVFGCSQTMVHDPAAAPHLAQMLPEQLDDFAPGRLELALAEDALEELAERAGLEDAEGAVAGATRSYTRGAQTFEFFVFELSSRERARLFYDAQQVGEPTPIPGFGSLGRTRVGKQGRYELETWLSSYFIRAIATDSERATRRAAFHACCTILDGFEVAALEPSGDNSKLAEAAPRGEHAPR